MTGTCSILIPCVRSESSDMFDGRHHDPDVFWLPVAPDLLEMPIQTRIDAAGIQAVQLAFT
jgi:hypothetical protein